MAEPASPPASTPPPPTQQSSAPGAQPLPPGLAGAPAAAQAPAQRPEFVEETFWDPATGTIKAEPLAKSYSELRTKFSKGVDGYKAELLKARPEKPEGYVYKAPEKGPLAERLAKNNLVILAEKPGDDFKPDAGKRYFTLNPADPMLAYWRKVAFDRGMSQEDFADGLVTYAENLAAREPTEDQIKAAQDAEFAKLGENGRARVAHLEGVVRAKIGDQVKHLDALLQNAEGVAALEALVEKLSPEAKFSPAHGAASAPDNTALLMEAKRLQGESDYYSNPEKFARVTEIYKKVYPGQSVAATPGAARVA